MASFNIHLAIGKRYVEKSSSISNVLEFYKGIISPDLVDDKKISHYTGNVDKNELLKYLAEKVCLDKFLKHENIDSDYQKGVFLHLITDYLFFNNFFDYSYLSNISYSEFCKDLYYSYDVTNEYLEDKYNIELSNFLDQISNSILRDKKQKNTTDEVRTNIIPIDALDKFIEYVSDINLEEYKNKIITNNGNVLP